MAWAINQTHMYVFVLGCYHIYWMTFFPHWLEVVTFSWTEFPYTLGSTVCNFQSFLEICPPIYMPAIHSSFLDCYTPSLMVFGVPIFPNVFMYMDFKIDMSDSTNLPFLMTLCYIFKFTYWHLPSLCYCIMLSKHGGLLFHWLQVFFVIFKSGGKFLHRHCTK